MPRKPSPLTEARRNHELARLKFETMQFEQQSKLLESVYGYSADGWEITDWTDRYRDGTAMWVPVNQYEVDPNQQVGLFIRNMTELSEARGLARILYGSNPFAIGVIDNVTSYTIGTGMTMRAVVDRGGDERLAAAVQRELDLFWDENEFGELQQEIFRRSRIDGECFYRFFADVRDHGRIHLRPVEPEQVRPPNRSEIDPEWSWGIRHLRTTYLDPATGIEQLHEDPETVLAYAVWYDDDHWDEVPADDILHIKCNVFRNVKRGISDLFPVLKDLDNARKLLRNLRDGAAIQAAITGIKQYEAASQTSVEAAIANQRTRTRTDASTGRTVSEQRANPGTVLHVGRGQTWTAPPFWSQNSINHIAIIQAALRAICVRWRLPEYASGDASNANYASTLVAGAPFVRAVREWQEFYRTRFLAIVWRALRHAYRVGRFTDLELTWEQLEAAVDIQCEPPQVEMVDPLQEAQVLNIEHQAGVVSKQTWRGKRGYDDEQERDNLRQEPAAATMGGMMQGALFDDPAAAAAADVGTDAPEDDAPTPTEQAAVQADSLRATVGGSQAIAALQRSYYAGEIPREAAIANARVVFGFSEDEADRLFPEQAPVKLVPEEPTPQQQSESATSRMAANIVADWNLRESRGERIGDAEIDTADAMLADSGWLIRWTGQQWEAEEV